MLKKSGSNCKKNDKKIPAIRTREKLYISANRAIFYYSGSITAQNSGQNGPKQGYFCRKIRMADFFPGYVAPSDAFAGASYNLKDGAQLQLWSVGLYLALVGNILKDTTWYRRKPGHEPAKVNDKIKDITDQGKMQSNRP